MRAKRAPCFLLTSSSIFKKFAKIALNYKIEEEVWAGWDFESHFWAEFWFRFWGCILDFSWTRICLFYGTFQFSGAVFDLFLDVLLNVLLGRFKQDFTLVDFWWIYRPIFTTLIKSRV